MCFWNFYVMVTLSEDDKFQPAERGSKCPFKNPKIMFSSQFLFDLLDKTVYDMQLKGLNTRWSMPSVSHLKAAQKILFSFPSNNCLVTTMCHRCLYKSMLTIQNLISARFVPTCAQKGTLCQAEVPPSVTLPWSPKM